MPTNCPKCGADTGQSSGVVCPACGHILQPGTDDFAQEQQLPRTRRSLRLVLAFLIPFVVGFSCVAIAGETVLGGLICGTILGLLFLGCFALASTRTSSAVGQAFGGLFLFLGLIAVVVGVVFFGCSFILR